MKKNKVLVSTLTSALITFSAVSSSAATAIIEGAPEFRISNGESDNGSISIIQSNPNSVRSERIILQMTTNENKAPLNTEALMKNEIIGTETPTDKAVKYTLSLVGSYVQAAPSGVAGFYVTANILSTGPVTGMLVGVLSATAGTYYMFKYVDDNFQKSLYNELQQSGELQKIGEAITALLNNENKQVTFKRVEAFNALNNIISSLSTK